MAHIDFLCAYAEALCGCGRYEEAQRELDRVMQWVSDDTPAQRAYGLRMLGITYSHSGDYQRAESVLSEALELLRILGDGENELMVLGLLSNTLFVLGKKEKAVETCHSAAEKCRELGGTINEARALIYLAFAAENTVSD